jgi:hypothetical protein
MYNDCTSAYSFLFIILALPENEYLNPRIIIQLSIKLSLLAAWHTSFPCPKEVLIKDRLLEEVCQTGTRFH